MKTCDLHTHSNFSDGTLSPEELIDTAINANLSAVALTDHNNLGGINRFLEYSQGKNIQAVAGVEFSTDYGKKELHLLGLFLKKEYFKQIDDALDGLRKRKEESNRIMIERLKNDGYDVDYNEIKEKCSGTVNRAHIGEALFKKGYVSSIKETFSTILSKSGKYYNSPKRLDVFETITLIRDTGAVPVLAHPFLDLKEEELKIFLDKAKKYGLIGMETVYSTYDDGTTLLAKKIVREYGLKESGGSDFHGERKPDISIGKGRGNLLIPYDFYLNLKC